MTNRAPQNPYLQSKIFTSSQPQLQMMLLEGAVRFGRQAQKVWNDPNLDAEGFLDRTIDVVEAMVHGVSGKELEIANRLEEQYAFLFRELASCKINRDLPKLEKVLELLEYERDTWKEACQLCDTLDTTNTPPADTSAWQGDNRGQANIPAPTALSLAPVQESGLSLEA